MKSFNKILITVYKLLISFYKSYALIQVCIFNNTVNFVQNKGRILIRP